MKTKKLAVLAAFAGLALATISGFALSQSDRGPVPDEWLTFAERSGYKKTPRYEETIAYSKKLAAFSPLISYGSIGKSREGRDIPLLVVSREPYSSPEAARRDGKAVILIQACIHAGEPDGKDAGLALLRDIALNPGKKGLLENTVILFIPIYNVDGHEIFGPYNRINQNGPEESGFRANSVNQNLNRDYIKADNPETRSWLRLWNEWSPDFFIDCHVTDGADFQFNITWEYSRHQEAALPLRRWMNTHFKNDVIPTVEAKGNLLSPYIQLADRRDPSKGMFTFIATPRFATGYTALRNRNGLLIEAHSLSDYGSRVRGTYDLLNAMIAEINENRDSLLEANREADREASARGSSENKQFPLLLSLVREPTRSFDFKGFGFDLIDSEASGTKKLVYNSKPLDVAVPWFDTAKISKAVKPPRFYIVPTQWTEVIDRLLVHGVRFERLKKARKIEVESYRFSDERWGQRPFEGRITLSAKVSPIKEERTFPSGSAVVPVDQPASAVAIQMLEPDGPDSLFYWGFFNAIFERKEYAETYALEKLAAKMLKEDPELKREFEEKLKDEVFAKDPRARLAFFYDRSHYKERMGIYPVGRILDEDFRP